MQHPSGGLVQKSTFARFLEFFNFRLFQQYRSKGEVTARRRHVRFARSRHAATASACRSCAKAGSLSPHPSRLQQAGILLTPLSIGPNEMGTRSSPDFPSQVTVISFGYFGQT